MNCKPNVVKLATLLVTLVIQQDCPGYNLVASKWLLIWHMDLWAVLFFVLFTSGLSKKGVIVSKKTTTKKSLYSVKIAHRTTCRLYILITILYKTSVTGWIIAKYIVNIHEWVSRGYAIGFVNSSNLSVPEIRSLQSQEMYPNARWCSLAVVLLLPS